MRTNPWCTCGFGQDPDCAIDHLMDQEERSCAIDDLAQKYLRDRDWVFGAIDESLSDRSPDAELWRHWEARDELAFMAKLRAAVAEQAKAEAADEVDTELRRVAA